MALKSDYNAKAMLQELEEDYAIRKFALFERVVEVCDTFVKDCKEQPEGHELGFYNNRTGDLRRSIASYVFVDGEMKYANEEGNVEKNRTLIPQDAIVKKGITAIGMAGMYYASWVQSKGYNVIFIQEDVMCFDLTTHFHSW